MKSSSFLSSADLCSVMLNYAPRRRTMKKGRRYNSLVHKKTRTFEFEPLHYRVNEPIELMFKFLLPVGCRFSRVL